MGCIVIALPKREDANNIAKIVKNHLSVHDLIICMSAAEVLRVANERDNVVVICTPALHGMSYLELADYLPSQIGIIVLTKDTTLELATDRMLRLVLPLKIRDLISSIEMSLSTVKRTKKKGPKAPVKRTPQEQHIIDEAKMELMKRKDMTEQEAFRYLQKSSMNSSRTLLETAQMVLLLSGD